MNGRNLLLQEFTDRRTRNAAYSLRAFSRDLGIGVTSLSDFLADKRKLSPSSLRRVAEALRLSPQQRAEWIGDSKNSRSKSEEDRLLLEEDTFRLIADWYYLATMNLARIKKNQANPAWISKRLGISQKEASEALKRLWRMGFIQITDGRMVRTARTFSTTRDVPSSAIRKHHSQNLLLAEKSLLNDPVESREFSSATMAVNPAKLKQAKDILMKTKRRITELLQDDNPSEVYVLSFQMFPLTKKESEK